MSTTDTPTTPTLPEPAAAVGEMLGTAEAVAAFVHAAADGKPPAHEPVTVAEWADDLCADLATLEVDTQTPE